jgi:hypothetical protein
LKWFELEQIRVRGRVRIRKRVSMRLRVRVKVARKLATGFNLKSNARGCPVSKSIICTYCDHEEKISEELSGLKAVSYEARLDANR